MRTLQQTLDGVEHRPPFRRAKEIHKALRRAEREGLFIRISPRPCFQFNYVIRTQTGWTRS